MRLLTWMSTAIFAFTLVCLGAPRVVAQQDLDSVKADAKHHKVEFENSEVRVVRWMIGKSPMHGHPDNVQVVLTDTTSTVTTPDGKTTPTVAKAGEVHWRQAGQHAVQNTGQQPFEGVLVEMKGGKAASAK